ncbi:MAG: hypothetical protein M1826_002769 [Phylliscum demangeonii]|nr:MAG: hypothetical protein M1826_002769 [Phylliscum demangeonii]
MAPRKDKASGEEATDLILQYLQLPNTEKDPKDGATADELVEMDKEIDRVKENIAALKAEHKALATTLKSLTSGVSTMDLREAVHELELKKKELDGRLGPLRAGGASLATMVQMQEVDREFTRVARMLCRRRAIFEEFWHLILERARVEGEVDEGELWDRLRTLMSAITPAPGLSQADRRLFDVVFGTVEVETDGEDWENFRHMHIH